MTNSWEARRLRELNRMYSAHTIHSKHRLIQPFLPSLAQWWDWLPVYWYIQSKPRARHAMHNHPGVRLMRRGNLIFLLLIAFIAFLGQCYQG